MSKKVRYDIRFVGADDSVRSAECSRYTEIFGEYECIFPFARRGRCPHRPGRMHRFYGILQRTHNFPAGRCRHRPLHRNEQYVCAVVFSQKSAACCRADRVVCLTQTLKSCTKMWGQQFFDIFDRLKCPDENRGTFRAKIPLAKASGIFNGVMLEGKRPIRTHPARTWPVRPS